MKYLIFTFIFICSTFCIISCKTDKKNDEQSADNTTGVIYQRINTGFTTGGKCKVVSGPNTGKEGTYDSEGSCCDESPGGWGCTDCIGTDGKDNGKCTDGKRVIVGDYSIDSTNVVILETTTDLPSGELIQCISFVDKKSGKVVKNDCHPLYVVSYADLKKSNKAGDVAITNSIETDMVSLKNQIKKSDK